MLGAACLDLSAAASQCVFSHSCFDWVRQNNRRCEYVAKNVLFGIYFHFDRTSESADTGSDTSLRVKLIRTLQDTGNWLLAPLFNSINCRLKRKISFSGSQ